VREGRSEGGKGEMTGNRTNRSRGFVGPQPAKKSRTQGKEGPGREDSGAGVYKSACGSEGERGRCGCRDLVAMN